MLPKNDFNITGFVAPGYEPVFKQFLSYYEKNYDTKSQLCAYVGNEKVIDICGNNTKDKYTHDNISHIYSSGKSIGSILIAIMVD
jgi:hypothetical protein